MAHPHNRHRDSLEAVINFSSSPPLNLDDRLQAKRRFYEIVQHYQEENTTSQGQYNKPTLVRLTYEYALSDKSRDNFLRAFFTFINLPMNSDEAIDFSTDEKKKQLLSKLAEFADFLVDNFFLPLKASTKRTPQPTPEYRSAIESARVTSQAVVGTPARLRSLRGDCLERDRHRCVISRRFDQAVAVKRMLKAGNEARDDDGQLFARDEFDSLEVAHILPHSLMATNSNSELDESRAAALKILNMFDNDVVHLIEGPEIDRPRNALTLTNNLHLFFGDFRIYFEPVVNEPNTYKIDTFLPYAALNNVLPVTRTLFLSDNRTIDPPSPRLLAIHRAIAHILHLSAAGNYVDRILDDMDTTRTDGSTELGRIAQLSIGGWLDGRIRV